MRGYVSNVMVVVAIAMYVASLTQVAFVCGTQDGWLGYTVLYMGAFMFFIEPRWLINPIFIIMVLQLLLSKKPWRSPIIPLLLPVIASSFLIWRTNGTCGDSGSPSRYTSLDVGGYFWIIAMFIGALAYGMKRYGSTKS